MPTHAAPRPKIRKSRKDSEATRMKIIDAAERLFSKRGFFGVSMRDITQEAKVPLALATHHFGRKLDLFRAVVERRAAEHSTYIRNKLAAVVAEAGDRPPTVAALLTAYLSALVELARIDEGWANYSRLAAKASDWQQNEAYSNFVLEFYFPVIQEYIEQLRRSLPTISKENLHWAFYFFESALVQFFSMSGLVDRQSDGLCRSSDLETILEKAGPFFAAGFHSFA
ncbi:MAG: TetR/AcrR family transcriptional regulator [Pirellulaceae bacterium]